MSQTHRTQNKPANATNDGRSENLRDSPMMAHLLDALEARTDMGHYGRLTFVMIARHFLPSELHFPDDIYDHINDFWEAEASHKSEESR